MASLKTYTRNCASGPASPKTRLAAKRTASRGGFTLIEIIVVLALIAVIGGFGLIVSLDSYRDFSFHNERDTLLPLFDKARNQAVTNSCIGATCTGGKAHGVYFGTAGSYTIFQGVNYASRDISADEIVGTRNPGVSVTGNGGVTEIVFSPRAATTSAYSYTSPNSTPVGGTSWSLNITDTAGHSSVMSFNSEGQISWTN